MAKLFILKTGNGLNSMSLRHHNKTYVVAFNEIDNVIKSRKYVCESSKIMLKNNKPQDISKLVYESLIATDIKIDDSIYADECAELIIPKKININKIISSLETIPLKEFTLYPMINNLGIVLVNELLEETHTNLVFRCETISPFDNVDGFRNSLVI